MVQLFVKHIICDTTISSWELDLSNQADEQLSV